jgi:hypothetical protein
MTIQCYSIAVFKVQRLTAILRDNPDAVVSNSILLVASLGTLARLTIFSFVANTAVTEGLYSGSE